MLDADVIIHFIKAGQFSLLLDIFPEYKYLILDVVYDEVTVNRTIKTKLTILSISSPRAFQISSLTQRVNPVLNMHDCVTRYSWAKEKVPAWYIAVTIRMCLEAVTLKI